MNRNKGEKNMNISHINYKQWLNSLPAAKNTAKINAGTLNSGITANSASTKGGVSDVKKVLYSGEIVNSDMQNFSGEPLTEYEFVPSSQRDYTVEDAINYQYNKEFTISLDDMMSGKSENIKLRDHEASIPQEFIDNLKQNGISENKYDEYWSSFYINGLNDENINNSIDYLASGYAVAKQNIEVNFTGEEKTNALESLENDFNKSAGKIADETAAEIGVFFDKNGAGDETQKIHDSVMKAYNDKADEYSKYISSNNDYAKLAGTENEWLKNDNSYMACKLRKTASTDKANDTEKTGEREYYSLDELEKTKDIVSEVKSDSEEISCYDDEEKIGFNLAQISLKGEVYSNYNGVSDSLKDSVTKSIGNIVNTMTDKLNGQLEKAREQMAEPEKMADLNKNDIFSVYNKTMNTYKNTGNIIKALQEGAAFGKSQHMSKTKEMQYSPLNRYENDGSIYWQNFYQNTLKYKKSTFGIVLQNDNGYIDKESGIDALTENWNSFVSKFTDSSSLKLSTGSFSVRA